MRGAGGGQRAAGEEAGKTAVIKTKSLERMPVVYFDEALLPYANAARYRRNSSLPEP